MNQEFLRNHQLEFRIDPRDLKWTELFPGQSDAVRDIIGYRLAGIDVQDAMNFLYLIAPDGQMVVVSSLVQFDYENDELFFRTFRSEPFAFEVISGIPADPDDLAIRAAMTAAMAKLRAFKFSP